MRLKKHKIFHSPGWYYDHCRSENGGSPQFRAMLKSDMAFIAADNDSRFCYQEKIGTYEERWNHLLSHCKSEDPEGIVTNEMLSALEREALKDYKREKSKVEDAEEAEPDGAAKNLAREILNRRMKLGIDFLTERVRVLRIVTLRFSRVGRIGGIITI